MKVRYISEWSNGTVITEAELNLVTGTVEADATDFDGEHLIIEYIESAESLYCYLW